MINLKDLRVLLNVVCLYIANSLPMYLATLALPTILRKQGTALSTIGLFGGLMLPWAFKFMWAPLLDKYYNPRLGKRKIWFISAQTAIILFLIILMLLSIDKQPILIFICLILLLIASATHYLASSAYIFEQIPKAQLRFGNYAQVIGTAFGSFMGGGIFLIVYNNQGWQVAMLYAIIISIILWLIFYFISEAILPEKDPTVKIVSPSFYGFIKRVNNRYLLYICLTYRGCEGIVMGMQQAFLVDKQVSISAIGKVMGVSGLTLSLIASGIISLILGKDKETRWLLILGVLRSICYVGLGLLAYFSVTSNILLFSVVLLNMACRAMEMVVLYTFFMKNCDLKQAATDIAILLGAEIIIYSLGMVCSGYLVEWLGYSGLFAFGSVLSIVSTLFCAHLIFKVVNLDKTLIKVA